MRLAARRRSPGTICVGSARQPTPRGALRVRAPSGRVAGESPAGRSCARSDGDGAARRGRRFVGRADELERSAGGVPARRAPRARRDLVDASAATPASARRGSCASCGTSSASETPRSRCAGPAAASAYGRGTTYRPLADVLREQLGLLETDARRDRARSASAGARSSGSTLGLDVGRPTSTRSPRARRCTRAGSRCSTSSSADAAGRAAGRGPALGPGAAARPARTRARRGHGAAAAGRHGAPGAARAAPGLGPAPRTPTTVWLEPLAGRRGATHARRSLCGDELPRAGPRRSCSSAPRETRSSSRSCSRAWPTASGAEPPIPDTVHAVLAARIDLLPADREGGAAGGGGDRPRLLARPGARAAGRAPRPTSRCSRRATSSGGGSGSALAGRARAHVQARADPRGRLRGRAEGAPRAPARRLRRLARAGRRRPRRARRPARAPLRRGRHGPRTPTWPGPASRPSSSGSRERPSRGSAEPPSSRSAATSSTRRSRCCDRALELDPEPRDAARASGARSGRANALRHDGEPFLAAMTRAIELAPGPRDGGRALRRPGVRGRAARRHVAPAPGPRARRRLDRARARARRARRAPARARALIARCVWAPARLR